MEALRLLAIDPGSSKAATSHTGIVLLDVTPDKTPVVVASWAVPGGIQGFEDWWWTACEVGPDIVVCEEFVNRNIRGADISPLLIEGAVRFLWPDARLQPAAGKNTAMPDEAMNRLGFTKDMFGKDHHQDRWEALRHALVYLKKERHRPTLETAFPKED